MGFRCLPSMRYHNLKNIRSITKVVTGVEDIVSIKNSLSSKGFAPTPFRILSTEDCVQIREVVMPALFRGSFETGVYPDEWHWRFVSNFPQFYQYTYLSTLLLVLEWNKIWN